MNFDLDEDQVMLGDLVSRFMAGRYDGPRRARYRAEPQGFSTDNWRTLANLGLLALPFAEEHGGMAGGAVELMVVMQALGRGLCAEPYLSDLLLAGRVLDLGGTAAQRAEWLPAVIAGRRRLALAHSETAGRFNPAYVACRAEGGRLSGAKTFVLAGVGVDGFIVSAREDGAMDAAEGLSLGLVRPGAPGLQVREYRLVDGSAACELWLEGVEAERLAGGGEVLWAAFDTARLAACAEMVGNMSMLMEATLEHLRTRRQFGQPIGQFQALQHRAAELYASLEQSRAQLNRAVMAAPGEAAGAIAGAKAFIASAAVKLGEACIQLHGGMGLSDELAIGHGHKRILLLATLLGDAEAELDRYLALAS